MRLDKVLSNGGTGSRKEIKELVKKGLISVNDNKIRDSAVHVDPEADTITVNNQRFIYKKYIYIMLNKPNGVITATADKFNKTVLDLIDESYKKYNLFPVGRLDKDTEGLILLTNDGDMAHSILSPKKHIPKKYFVKFLGKLLEKDIETFEQGVILEDGYKTMPSQIKVLTEDEYSSAELIIFEGKFHQVKRMFEVLGKKVVYLKRLSIANLILDPTLELGQYRELNDDETKTLLNI